MCRSMNQLRVGPQGRFQRPRTPVHCRRSCRQVFCRHAVALSLRARRFLCILAPMAGVSEAPFRQICRRMGADVVLSRVPLRPRPSAAASATRSKARSSRRSSGRSGSRSTAPIPNAMAEAAALITEHYRPEFIDINFGCPVKKVVQRNGGSGCLRDLDLVDRIIRAVIGATHLPVTVKTRSGWNDEQRDPVGIALRMQDAGARAFTLHARTRTQMFSGRGRLGRDRPRGRGARHPGHRQRRRRRPPTTSCACATTPAARAS